MKVLTLLALFVALLGVPAYGQSERSAPTFAIQKRGRSRKPTAGNARKAAQPSPLAVSAAEIKAARPEVTYSTLYDDIDVVEDSLPTVREIFRLRGFNRGDAEGATLSGWEQLRVRRLKPTEMLSR